MEARLVDFGSVWILDELLWVLKLLLYIEGLLGETIFSIILFFRTSLLIFVFISNITISILKRDFMKTFYKVHVEKNS